MPSILTSSSLAALPLWFGRRRHGNAVLIVCPIGGIVQDIFADAFRFPFITDDVFVIITLPQASDKRRPSRLFDPARIQNRGDGFRFKCTHHIPTVGATLVVAPVVAPMGVWVITMIPCTWLGIITNASRSIVGKRRGNASHSDNAIRPASFNRISPSTTSPNTCWRSCVHMVTKYAPTLA